MEATEYALRIRNLITEQNENATVTLPRIQAALPTALEAFARECFQDREKRELLKRQFLADVDEGVLYLTPFLDGSVGRINLKELKEATIYAMDESDDEAIESTYTWVGSYQQLIHSRPVGGDAKACYLEGVVLRLRDEDGALNSDQTIMFTVPSFPNDVTEIPAELEHGFIAYVAAMFANSNG